LREKLQGKIRVRIQIHTGEVSDADIKTASELLDQNKGQSPVGLNIFSKHPEPMSMNVRKHVVDPNDALLRELRVIFGKENVWLEKYTV
jgi:hypothetical protein